MADITTLPPTRRKGDTTLGHIAYVLRDNPVTLLAFGMLAFFLGCALLGPSLVPYDPLTTNAAASVQMGR